MYQCTCPGGIISDVACKHIHAVHTLYGEKLADPVVPNWPDNQWTGLHAENRHETTEHSENESVEIELQNRDLRDKLQLLSEFEIRGSYEAKKRALELLEETIAFVKNDSARWPRCPEKRGDRKKTTEKQVRSFKDLANMVRVEKRTTKQTDTTISEHREAFARSTRTLKNTVTQFCAACNCSDDDGTDTIVDWIVCGSCHLWFHNTKTCLGSVHDKNLDFFCHICDRPDELFIENLYESVDIPVQHEIDIC